MANWDRRKPSLFVFFTNKYKTGMVNMLRSVVNSKGDVLFVIVIFDITFQRPNIIAAITSAQ